jgi:hypothetical protein
MQTTWKTTRGHDAPSAAFPVAGITTMQQQRKRIAHELNQILALKQAACLTIDGSALSVNIAGLEGQDAALNRAIAEGFYVVCIIGWYPASKNANHDTNANAMTRSFKSHLWELLGCDDREALVCWVDCWQFCHNSRNASMHYNEIKKFVSTSIRTQNSGYVQTCLRSTSRSPRESSAVTVTITWVMKGIGETLAAFSSIWSNCASYDLL